jgi:hypothetical protein
MKKIIFWLAAASVVFAMNSCGYTLLTTAQCNEQVEEGRMGKLQLYIDRSIEIERVVTGEKTELKGGTLTTRKGIDFYTIEFGDKLGGIAIDASDGNKVRVQFDKGKDDILTFRNFGGDDYYYLAGRNSADGYLVNYAGFSDFKVLEGQQARLLMKRNDKVKVKKKKSKAKGMYVK